MNSIRVRSRVYFEKGNPPSLEQNFDSEKLKRRLCRIFDLYSQISKAVYGLQEIVHSNAIFAGSVNIDRFVRLFCGN